MHSAIEPENWTDLLQALTFMATPDADPSDPLAWANAHEYRLEQVITVGRFVSKTGREMELYVTDVMRAVGGDLERLAQLGRERPPADWESESSSIGR